MDVASLANLSSSVAETGVKQEVGLAVLKRAQQIQASTAAQLINSVSSPPTLQNLPAHLGNTINTSA
ncbi:YjfB family protein [Massilia sp. TSP1-1-2]|uniref:YjfB family protein n=1 Tax=unclassified Massilia TaxID=2609279 RepID=UPI003CF0C4B0